MEKELTLSEKRRAAAKASYAARIRNRDGAPALAEQSEHFYMRRTDAARIRAIADREGITGIEAVTRILDKHGQAPTTPPSS